MLLKQSWAGLLALGLLLAFGLLVQPALAQQVTATITGTVVDPSGAPIVSADVTAIDVDRGVTFPTKTNEQGVYVLPRIPVGNYKLKVEAKGFEIVERPPFTLVLNQTARIDAQLKIGQGAEVVEVTGAAPTLQTDTTELSTLIDAKTNEALPLATRNYIQLTLLSPGAVTPDPASMTTGADMTSSGRPYINGNRQQANNFMLDGIDNNEFGDNEVGYSPSVDAIQEFNLISQNASAEYGNFQGGIVNTTIKSGTNAYHGDVFEFFRNDVLNANSWANGITDAPKPQLRWNMFGATFGGPIVKNKLFFFVDYQGQRFHQIQKNQSYTVMTAAQRAGDFGYVCGNAGGAFDAQGVCRKDGAVVGQLYNPDNIVAGQRQPFAFNKIPTSMYSPVVQKLLASQYYPQPTNGAAINNFFATTYNIYNNDQGDAKVDYIISDKDRVFGRWSQMHLNEPVTSTYALAATGANSTDEPAYNFVTNWDHTFSSALLNEVRFGFNWVGFHQANSDNGVGNLSDSLGIANGNANGPGLVQLTPGGNLSTISNNGILQNFGDTVIQLTDTAVWTRGKHVFHMGLQYNRYRMDSAYAGNSGLWGQIGFGGGFTSNNGTGGDPVADFVLGLPSSVARGGALGWGQRSNLFAGFFQDDWRITDELTLNLGLRYEHNTPWVEKDNHQVNFGEFSGAVQFAGKDGNNDALYDSYNGIGNWQPRIGLAWAPKFWNRKTVFRAAYTVSSYSEGMGSNNRLSQNTPFVPAETSQQFTGFNDPTWTLSDGLPPSPPPGPYTGIRQFAGAQIRLWDPHWRPAMVQQWNFTVQHEFTPTLSLEAGYVGQHGTHLTNFWWANQLVLHADGTTSPGPFVAGNPTLKNEIGAIRMTLSNGGSRYDAFQTTLEKRFSSGLQGQLAYTLSNCNTDAVGFYGNWSASQTDIGMPSPQNIYNPQADWGHCNFDVTHVITGYFNYDLPFGHGKRFGSNLNPIANGFIGNWSTSGILNYHTGFALNFVNGWTYRSGTNDFMERPDVIGSVHYPETHIATGIQWIDPSSFQLAQAGTFGNEKVGDLRGPGLATFDFGLHKAFSLGEQRRIEFRVEAINLFNHPVMYIGAANLYLNSGAGNAGVVNQSKDERNLQLALKFYF